jgi:hypothetical protein
MVAATDGELSYRRDSVARLHQFQGEHADVQFTSRRGIPRRVRTTQDRTENARVAVLSTGVIGSAMPRNLIASRLATTVWDGSPSAAAPLAEAERGVAPSPANAVTDARGDHDAVARRRRERGDVLRRSGRSVHRGRRTGADGHDGRGRYCPGGSRPRQRRPDLLFVGAPVPG